MDGVHPSRPQQPVSCQPLGCRPGQLAVLVAHLIASRARTSSPWYRVLSGVKIVSDSPRAVVVVLASCRRGGRGAREEAAMVDYEVFDLGDVRLRMGATLRDAKLAYKTYGELNQDRSNAVVYPTWYSGQHYDNEWLIGEGMALDPARYFIIVPNMLGNGLSSSPSNTPPPTTGPGSSGDRVRQRDRPAPAGHRAVRHPAAGAGDWLVNGRRPDLPVGGQPPRDGPTDPAVLWLGQDQ